VGRRNVFLFARLGALLGLGIGWLLARVFRLVSIDWRDGSELASSLLFQAVGAFCAMVFAASRPVAGVKPPRYGELGRAADV